MIQQFAFSASKKLALKFILENIEYKKRCIYLQEIIAMGKENKLWVNALITFFDTPFNLNATRPLALN